MRLISAPILVAAALVIVPGCKKKGGDPGPGGWLVGDEGLMAAVTSDGTLGTPYELGTRVNLTGIACRGTTDAFVVGDAGTFLRTFDGGDSWESIDIGTVAPLRAVADDAAGSVLIAGDDALWLSHDSGARFAAIATGRFVSVAMADADTALALDDTATLWRVTGDGAAPIAPFAGATTVALAHRGLDAVLVGTGGILARSHDGGVTWQVLSRQPITLHAAWIASDGATLAVGDDGAVVNDTTITTIGDTSLRALHIDATGVGLAAGDDGTVLATDDAGATWRALDLAITTTIRGLDQLDGHGHW